ncbi:MAG TPA: hypothetical protein VG937_04695 [Polyangiaceae bacterium]|nr:hypothetical protein [Polyangiaceae bacterium]
MPGKAGAFNFGTGGVLGRGGSSSAGEPTISVPGQVCTAGASAMPVFADQVVRQFTFQRELYSWTTAEQEAEIRAGRVLLTRSEREGLGPGFAFDSLKALASANVIPEQQQLAALLTSARFANGRYAWPHPWATRLGWPGESYGNRLLRLVLRADAWMAVFAGGQLQVFDASNARVSLADALARPERLAGFFFLKDAALMGPICGGTFGGGGVGYREFLISNEAMIEEWSIGTETIRARLSADIGRLEEFFDRVRACPEAGNALSWNHDVNCAWQSNFVRGTEQSNYEAALAMPSENYLPTPARLAALIETLRDDLFEPDPFSVKPGE